MCSSNCVLGGFGDYIVFRILFFRYGSVAASRIFLVKIYMIPLLSTI
jgi:hypothetical protein